MRRVASLSDILNEFGVELGWSLSVYADVYQANDYLYDRNLKELSRRRW